MSRPTQTARNAHRVLHDGKRHFELIASVSRSSGLEKDGDALRNFRTQEEYRGFIQGKLDEYWRLFPYGHPAQDVKRRDEVQANILILFRKLREGILSTKRSDAFALEVYETSLYLTAFFSTPAQTTSIISQLLPHMYLPFSTLPASCSSTALLSLVHFLVAGYPSQSRFFEHLLAMPRTFMPRSSAAYRWVWALARALRQRNYARLERLTEHAAFADLMPQPKPIPKSKSKPRTSPASGDGKDTPKTSTTEAPENLSLAALSTLVDALRDKARDTTWSVLRSAYRELYCPKPSGSDVVVAPTRLWLCRSLVLQSTIESADGLNDTSMLDEWLEKKRAADEIRPKEGAEGRWIVLKAK